MIRLINSEEIKKNHRLDRIQSIFEKKLCSRRQKGFLRRKKMKDTKRNEFIFKSEYAVTWRIQIIKLICGLSILYKPTRAPASHVGINNPKKLCFAIVSLHCFLRCTRMIEEIAITQNKERCVFEKLLFNTLVEIQSAGYIKTLLCKDDSQRDEEEEEEEDKNDYIYAQFPKDYISESNTDGETDNLATMAEYRDGEPHGKL